MNSRKAQDAPLILQPDPEAAKELDDYQAEMAIRNRRVMEQAVSAVNRAPRANSGPAKGNLRGETRGEAVWRILSDGGWHKTTEFLGWQTGGSEGTRRLRELRKLGYRIEKRRIKGSAQWLYRLTGKDEK